MIEIEDLFIEFPGFALQNINLSIRDGEFFMFLGPTGAGKTLILEAIAGIVPITSGHILVKGKDIRELLKKLHQEVETTFLMVTHDFAEAMFLGQRMAVLNDGKIDQIGFVREVFKKPATPFTAKFMGIKNVFHASFKDKKARVHDLELHLQFAPGENKR